MQRKISISKLADLAKSIKNGNRLIVLRRNNKEIGIEKQEKDVFLNNLSKKLEKSERELKEGKVHEANVVFEELRKKYAY